MVLLLLSIVLAEFEVFAQNLPPPTVHSITMSTVHIIQKFPPSSNTTQETDYGMIQIPVIRSDEPQMPQMLQFYLLRTMTTSLLFIAPTRPFSTHLI